MRAEHLQCLSSFEHKVMISNTEEQNPAIRQQLLLLYYAQKRSELDMVSECTNLSSRVNHKRKEVISNIEERRQSLSQRRGSHKA
jgi:hypothetical protein